MSYKLTSCGAKQGVKLTSFYAGLKSTFQKKGPHFAKIIKSEAILLNTKINTKKNDENAGFFVLNFGFSSGTPGTHVSTKI